MSAASGQAGCILVTGGAGFIGSALVRELLRNTSASVVSVDALTYAGSADSLADLPSAARHVLEVVDIRDARTLAEVFRRHRPQAVMHLAAETHVDRSIAGPSAFVHTNVLGTFTVLEVVRDYLSTLGDEARAAFRFLQVSTDEVYGDVAPEEAPRREGDVFHPGSPYSASKAAADHLLQAWHRTYGLPVLVTRCSNNVGPRQYPEKLIPLCIQRALSGQTLPLFGDGLQLRDWLHVDDHARALRLVLEQGVAGQVYHVSSGESRSNLEVVTLICALLDELAPQRRPDHLAHFAELIRHVADRPGHDRRYALDSSRLRSELGWRPQHDFADAMRQTVRWYLENPDWSARMLARQTGCPA